VVAGLELEAGLEWVVVLESEVAQVLVVVQGFVVVARGVVAGPEIVHSLALLLPACPVAVLLLVECLVFLAEMEKVAHHPLVFPEIPAHIQAEEEAGKIVDVLVVVHKEENWMVELGKQH